MSKKPVKRADLVEVSYSKSHWKLFQELRKKTIEVMKSLENANLMCIVHGSIARGDVSANSDIDVFVIDPSSSFLIESALERAALRICRRVVVQATPSYAAKGYLEIDAQRIVSFPLMKMRPIERDFYGFGGEATLTMLEKGQRVIGVDKRLMLIEPTEHGHIESAIVGREQIVAKMLEVSTETVLDRVRALTRRDQVGRTGVFIERELNSDETFEMVLGQLADANPAVRRRLKLHQR